MRKGISPLIAAVLLIAFTMAIAGIMATWATTFSRERLEQASSGSECIGALDLSSLSFSNGVVSVRVRNLGKSNLTGLTANIEYTDTAKSKIHQNIRMVDHNFTDPLGVGSTDFFIYNTGDATTPQKIEIVAQSCRDFPAFLYFRT